MQKAPYGKKCEYCIMPADEVIDFVVKDGVQDGVQVWKLHHRGYMCALCCKRKIQPDFKPKVRQS